MAKRSITVALDEETIRELAVLAEPSDVLAHLADAAAEGSRRPGGDPRRQTDRSLRTERAKTDTAMAEKRLALEHAADEVVRIARRRADEVVQVARDDADA